MTTSIQIINWGPMPVKVEQTSHDNRTVHTEEIVQPYSISKVAAYAHQVSRVVITEMEPK